MCVACRIGDIETIRYCFERRHDTAEYYNTAAITLSLSDTKYGRTNSFHDWVMREACLRGFLNIAEWVVAHGAIPDELCFRIAIAFGKCKVAQWCIDKGVKVDTSSLSYTGIKFIKKKITL